MRTIEHNIISCARCGNCWRICPEGAIEFEYLLSGGWKEVVSTQLVSMLGLRRTSLYRGLPKYADKEAQSKK